MLNDATTPLSLLATRRSGKPRDLVAPGPDAAQLATMLAIAARVPDHGKLAPWRFVVVGDSGTLESALRIPGGVVETVERVGGTARVEASEQVRVGALRPLDRPRYARPAPGD